eukprot:14677554-Alexandrium_andersonii.AAC.1
MPAEEVLALTIRQARVHPVEAWLYMGPAREAYVLFRSAEEAELHLGGAPAEAFVGPPLAGPPTAPLGPQP